MPRLMMMSLYEFFLFVSTVAFCAIGNFVTARCTHQNGFVQLDKMPTGRYGYQGLLASDLATE